MAARKSDESNADYHFSAQLYNGGAKRLRRNLRELALYRDTSMAAVLVSLVEDAIEKARKQRASRTH